eukprot:6205276-Pleurochrysis_carterae.AAC.5
MRGACARASGEGARAHSCARLPTPIACASALLGTETFSLVLNAYTLGQGTLRVRLDLQTI